jgi:hypothetical protein
MQEIIPGKLQREMIKMQQSIEELSAKQKFEEGTVVRLRIVIDCFKMRSGLQDTPSTILPMKTNQVELTRYTKTWNGNSSK